MGTESADYPDELSLADMAFRFFTILAYYSIREGRIQEEVPPYSFGSMLDEDKKEASLDYHRRLFQGAERLEKAAEEKPFINEYRSLAMWYDNGFAREHGVGLSENKFKDVCTPAMKDLEAYAVGFKVRKRWGIYSVR